MTNDEGPKTNDFTIRVANKADTDSIQQVVFTVLCEYGLIPDPSGKDIDLQDVEKNYIEPNGYW